MDTVQQCPSELDWRVTSSFFGIARKLAYKLSPVDHGDMSRETKGFLVYLGDALHKRLRIAAAVHEVSMTQIAARAIERELNHLEGVETKPVDCTTCGRRVDVPVNAGGNPQMAMHRHDSEMGAAE